MWTPATGEQHSRDELRSSTDLTNTEWDVIAPLLPTTCPLGRLFLEDLPPKSTVYGSFSAWRDSGLFTSINHHLVMLDRERVGREASPTAAVLDSQSVKTTESGGPRGYDAGKKVKGRKRQALVLDPPASRRAGPRRAVPVLKQSRHSYPFITKAFADTGYAGDRPASATLIAVEILRKSPGQIGFVVHPRRWVVERFFAWISRNRRLWNDPEATIASAKAFLRQETPAMPDLPARFAALIITFAPLFDQRSWRHAQVLLVGAIRAPGRRTVASVLRITGHARDKHFTNYHRVLSPAAWSARGGARILLGHLVRAFAPRGPVVIGLDDTIERRWGPKIAARGIYQDPVRSSHSHFVKMSGLRWISLMLLAPVP